MSEFQEIFCTEALEGGVCRGGWRKLGGTLCVCVCYAAAPRKKTGEWMEWWYKSTERLWDLSERLVTLPVGFPIDFAYEKLSGKGASDNHVIAEMVQWLEF